MKIEVFPDAAAAAREAADRIVAALRAALDARATAHLAVSGGTTPRGMLTRLLHASLPWPRVHLWQVDERVAPWGDPARNWTHVQAAMRDAKAAADAVLHPMPVEAPPLDDAARRYARELETCVGTPPLLDVVHLGLGGDGHTASLFPGDPVLSEASRAVMATAPHAGWRRMTLTLPVLDRARDVLWLVTGAGKAGVLARLVRGDPELPASRVSRARARLVASRDAACGLEGRAPDSRHVDPS